jgi:glycosyltransferase involved in cell wall biosynthesis
MAAATRLQRAAVVQDRPDEVLPAAPAARAPQSGAHVCFVAPYAWPVFSGNPEIQVVGGAEVQQSILARLFAANGYRVTMICQDFGQPDRVEIDGVVVRKVFSGAEGIPVVRFLHPRLTKMWRVLGEVNADIYYYRSASMWVGILDAFCRRYGKRLVYSGAANPDFARDIGGQIRFARDRWLYRRGVAGANAVVVQNPRQLEWLRETYGREGVHIPSCYVPPPSARAGGGDLVLWVAMLRRQKRPELFLELARRLPAWRFAMVGGAALGDPEFYARIEAQARQLPNVEFAGFVPHAEAEKWFDRARVLVNTSLFEGMPNTFLQAWARGVPTLSFVDVGTTVNRKVQDIDEMGRELERLLTDGAAWRDASARSREHFARTHSPEEVMRRYARVFERVMHG